MNSQLSRNLALAGITLVYFGLYFGAVFSRVADAEFMSTDPHSIVNGIHALFEKPFYSMNGHYHSIVYGWTYFACNFVLIAPLKIFGVDNPLVYNVVIRGFLFIVGYGLLLSLFNLGRRAMGVGAGLSVTLILATNHIAARAFIEIHPESTGVLFHLLGVVFLAKVLTENSRERRNYVIAMLFLSLSALAKQPFAVIAFATWLCFAKLYAERAELSIVAYVRSRIAAGQFIGAALIFFVMAFLIHPFAFLDFDTFLQGQMRPLRHASGNTLAVAAVRWWAALTEEPLGFINFCLLALLPLQRLVRWPRVFLYSVLASACVSLLFIYMQKLVPRATYLYPLYPIYLLNIVFAGRHLFSYARQRAALPTFALSIALGVLLIPLLALNLSQALYLGHSRVFQSGYSTKNLSWDYLQKLPADTRIAFMPAVAVPPTYDKRCHTWRYCKTAAGIKAFNPEIVFVRRRYGRLRPQVFADHIENKNYEHIATITADRGQKVFCGLLGKSIGYRITANSALTAEKSAKYFASLSMLDNLNLAKSRERISNCVDGYRGNLNARKHKLYTGHNTEVWGPARFRVLDTKR